MSLNTQDKTFSEITKIVGQRWQMLPAGAHEIYQLQADANKRKYAAEMAGYVQTVE